MLTNKEKDAIVDAIDFMKFHKDCYKKSRYITLNNTITVLNNILEKDKEESNVKI